MHEPFVPHSRRLWLYAFAALVLVFLVAPVFIVIPMSFSGAQFLTFPPESFSLRWYRNYLESPEWLAATWISLKAAVLTTLVATPLGIAAAYGLNASRTRLATMAQVALVTPLLIPVIILGVGVFYLYVQIGLVNTLLGLVLAHSILAIPFVMVTVTAGLRQFDLNQERVARSLGATRLRAFMTVTLPQLRNSIVAGGLFAFITSLDEVVIALFISSGPQSTLTRRMFSGLRDQVDPTIAAVSSLLIVLSVALLGTAQLLQRRR
ncbi:ABC transporter permease [Marinimicrococcus flavescens]|uniref:ABC transporter permease n=1 Tax=Marinimicrococcus flavescens TaxID=3031815 RepID=A0AAP4D6A1_9PROT|nr:ABC transporter permease [Marinimicrococcus flavescens]